MKSDDGSLPKRVAQKLRAIRRRAVGFTLLRGLILSSAVLLGAVLAAMTLDWAFGWFDTRVRYLFTCAALAAAAAAFVAWCAWPLARRRTIVATAREVDQTIPQLEERWSTVTELSQSKDSPEVRGSDAMIRQVASEAELASATVTPEAVVSSAPVWRASRWLAGATVAFICLFAISFMQATLLLKRLCMPGANISLTQVSASPANVWVPKGEPLTLNAAIKGRVPKAPAQLFLRPEHGSVKTVAMTAKAGTAGAFLHAIDGVSDSFQYRVRAGDGQTDWQRITAVDRPKISEVKLKVSPPAYSKLPVEEKKSLPNAVRVLQGSDVEMSFRSDQPLDRMLLDFGGGQTAQLTAGKDNWYAFRTLATNSFTVAAAAINKFKLENKNKPSCHINVYEDLPPNVKILEPSDNIAVLPGEKVNVTFEASDDFGLAKAEMLIATTKSDGETNAVTIPVDLASDAGKKHVRKSVEMDPKALGLKNGDQLSYTIQVTDTKQTLAAATLEQNVGPKDAENIQDPSYKLQTSSKSQTKEEKQDEPKAGGQNAEAKDQTAQENRASSQAQASDQNQQSAKNGKQNQQKPNNGDKPPPNEMAMRVLDAGQTAECKARNIKVDEWAGSFEGEKRKKLEIAIDPVLKKLAELLAKAQEKTDSLKKPAASTEGLQQPHSEALEAAKGNLTESQQAIGDLKSRTYGTPYAFVGLQLYNIGEAHVGPAQKNLSAVTIPAANASNNVAQLDRASFHIARASEMLADLTKTYETVKRDQQIADAMQKLNKMYQIFLEDSQALLGSTKGPINSYNRKIAEVNDEFVEKLKELLEQKKKIMAELAKLLSDDPRMLRRYLAMLELQGTNYRDQLTLLAERQKLVQQQVTNWNATAEAERGPLLQQLGQTYAAQQQRILQDATKLRENMETWLPLDVKVDNEAVQAALARAEKVAQLTAESMRPEGTNAAAKALAELRTLRETAPHLSELPSTNKTRMATYVANRLPEIESLITAQSGQITINEALKNGDFPRVAEIVQYQVTRDTTTLESKLEATENQVARMSDQIAEKAAALNKIMEADIMPAQQESVDDLSAQQMKPAEQTLNKLPPSFASAETTFDELMRLIIAKLDEAPPPNSPGGAPPGLDSLLAMLEDEMKANEGLGIPCRPLNISLMRDWLRPDSNPGQGMGQAQAQAAHAQAEHAKGEAQRIEKQARESAQKALAEAQKQGTAETADFKKRGEAWNKPLSRLQKHLLQGRDNTPPEQYRAAIENYFKIISETATGAEK